MQNMFKIGLLVMGLLAATSVPSWAQNVVGADVVLRMLDDADANGDTMITRDEFLAYRASLFNRLDRNRDGVLDGADSQVRFRNDRALSLWLGEVDANGDGRVTRDEFNAAPPRLFDKADLNHDGVVDPFERSQLQRR